MCNLSLTCLLCSLWSWGSIWTACFWTCATMLRWVEFRCARCWTSAANTLGTPLATLPSPTSENWSDWYWEAYPRYVPHFFDVEQLEHSEIFSLFLPYHFIPGNEGWNNSYVFSCFFFPCCLHSVLFFTPVLCFSCCLSHSFPQLDGLLTDRESLPERSKEIRERLRGKGLPSGKMSSFDQISKYSSGWKTTCRLL